MATAKTQEFSGNILSGENVQIDDFTFIITMDKYARTIFVDAGTIFQSVPLFKCEKMEHFEICFENTTFNEDDNELYAVVRISRYKPDVTITREINDSEFYVGQEALIKITISNSGDTASDITMTDTYPSSIEAYDMEGGCSIHENQVYWQGHLDAGKKKECQFVIKGRNETHQSLAAHLKYWDGFKWIDKYSTALKIDINPLIQVISSIVREDYEVDGTTFDFDNANPGIDIGETLRLLVNISSNYEDEVDVDKVQINLPSGLEYQSTGYLRFNYINSTGNRSSIVWYSDRINKVSSSELLWSGTLNNKSSKLFVIKLKAKRSGNQNIMILTSYKLEGSTYKNSIYDSFDVWDAGIGLRMTVSDKSKRFSAPVRLDAEDDNIDVEALHPYNINVYAQNNNHFAVIDNVVFWTIQDLAGLKEVRYVEMDKEGQRIPYSFILIPPQVSSNKEFKFNVSFRYTNEFDEIYTNSTEFIINVIPSKDLTISLESSEGEVLNGGEETEIKVKIKNDRLIDIKDATVSDTVDDELYLEGVHMKKLKLNKESETEAYTYKIKAPVLHDKKRYNITSTVTYFDPDSRLYVNFSEVTEITVEPLKPSITVSMTLDKPETIYPGTLIPVEYTITNEETLEPVRDITIHFPVQIETDLVGPKEFFIDKLLPGESSTVKDLIKIRPKLVMTSLKLNKTIVEYFDNYGNIFTENSTEDSFEVEDARISGPALFMRVIAPAVINKSTSTNARIEVKNNGSQEASATIWLEDKAFNITALPSATKYIEYPVMYDVEGNYTIPAPEARFDFQGVDAYTIGTGTDVEVKLLLGPGLVENITEEVAPVEVIAPVPPKEEMSLEEYAALENKALVQRATRYALIAVVIIVGFLLAGAYMMYSKRKPSEPFIEAPAKK